MDWDKLRVFHAVANAGSLTHAGDMLHLSQSAISRQIRGLEEQLQATLFHRHARGLLLTEQGELLYDATRAMSKRLNAAAARIRDSKDEVSGELRITATQGFGTLWLAPRLGRLFAAHPNLSVQMILTEAVLDLPMREADVAIRMSSPQQADLIRRPLMNTTMRLYASASYLARHGAPESPSDLAGHRIIAYAPDSPQPHEAADWLAKDLAVEPRLSLSINSYPGVLRAAQEGHGIAILPDYLTREWAGLEHVLPQEASPPISLFFTYPEELRHSKRVIAFRDFVVAEVEAFHRAAATPSLA